MKLTEHRWVQVIWCDDIRQEVGNKPSLMGVYTGSLVVPSLPTVIPRLAVWVSIYTPKTQPFKALKVRICNSEDDTTPVAEIQVDAEQLIAAADQPLSSQGTKGENTGNENLVIGISFIMLLGQIQLSEKTRWLKVWVDTESEILESFKLRIDTPSSIRQKT